MNKKTRLELTDTGMSAAQKLAEGNPGAITAIVDILKNGDWIDPLGMGSMGTLLWMDSFGIYGSRIWMLYKDVCDRDAIKMIAAVRACQLGIISEGELNSAIDGISKLDLDNLLSQVKERLGSFGERKYEDTLVKAGL